MVESKELQEEISAEGQDGAQVAVPRDEALAEQLRRTSELIAAQKIGEAEALLLAARNSSPADLRVLKLLALVRFKLGRLPEAHDVYREAAAVAPDDATVRLNLGLIALKLESFVEAADELEAAVRLQPDDRRAWSYLGYAYAKNGAATQAAVAFRRAGQHELAAEMERAATPASHAGGEPVVEGLSTPREATRQSAATESSSMATPRPVPRDDTPVPGPSTAAAAQSSAKVTTLASFATSRLLSFAPSQEPLESLAHGVLRFSAGPETHVRETALLVALGGGLSPARGRIRGHLSDSVLAHDGDRLFRVDGAGELLIASPDRNRHLVALSLDRDVLYLEASRVIAWGDEIVWEAGSVPGNGTALLQFRGTGRVVILSGEDELVAVRIAEGDCMTLPTARLAGWVGHVVVQARPGQGGMTPAVDQVSCEGEGVLLISKHGEPG